MKVLIDKKTGLAYRPGTYDLAVIREQTCYAKTLSYCNRVLDIGGNIGSFAYKAKQFGALYVESYEPDPDNIRVHRYNARKVGNTLIEKAVVGVGGPSEVQFFQNVGKNKGMHSMVPTRGRDIITVPTIPIDKIFSEATVAFDTVKIDIEGGEYAVLDGFIFPIYVKRLAMEIHFSGKFQREGKPEALHNHILSQGFDCIKEGNLTKTNWADVFLYERE